MTTDSTGPGGQSYAELGQAPFEGQTVEGCNDPRVDGKLFRADRTNQKTVTATGEDGRALRIPYSMIRPTGRTFALQALPAARPDRGEFVTADALVGRGKWNYPAGTLFVVTGINERTISLAVVGGDGRDWRVPPGAVKKVSLKAAAAALTAATSDVPRGLVAI